MKKKLILNIFIISIIMGGMYFTKTKFIINKSDEVKPKISLSHEKAEASYKKISGLEGLKNRSDTIVEAEGTDKYELIDYKGVKMRKSTVKVIDVIKGNKQLKELKFLQSEGVKGEEPLANGEKVLMFLRKGFDNTDSYVTFGGTQGVYKIVQSTNDKNNNGYKHLEPHSMLNKDILKDLSGNYDNVKKKLAN